MIPWRPVLDPTLVLDQVAGRRGAAIEAGPSQLSRRGRHVLPGSCSALEAARIRIECDPVGTRAALCRACRRQVLAR